MIGPKIFTEMYYQYIESILFIELLSEIPGNNIKTLIIKYRIAVSKNFVEIERYNINNTSNTHH